MNQKDNNIVHLWSSGLFATIWFLIKEGFWKGFRDNTWFGVSDDFSSASSSWVTTKVKKTWKKYYLKGEISTIEYTFFIISFFLKAFNSFGLQILHDFNFSSSKRYTSTDLQARQTRERKRASTGYLFAILQCIKAWLIIQV